jgi:hypothetical protein
MDYLDDAIIEALSEFDGWVCNSRSTGRGASELSDQSRGK